MNPTTNTPQHATAPEGLYTPDCIRTYSGHFLNVLQPDAAHICIEDITHALSQQVRWGGHTAKPYTIGQHCLECADRAPKGLKLTTMMHDSTETYLIDVPSPVKKQLTNYYAIEDKLMQVIAAKFGFQWPLPEAVKAIDKAQLEWEWQHIVLPAKPTHHHMSPAEVKYEFLRCLELYSKTTFKVGADQGFTDALSIL